MSLVLSRKTRESRQARCKSWQISFDVAISVTVATGEVYLFFPSQFEFEMGFRSVWLQRLPFFDQVIAIFEKDLENIDVSRPFLPASDL